MSSQLALRHSIAFAAGADAARNDQPRIAHFDSTISDMLADGRKVGDRDTLLVYRSFYAGYDSYNVAPLPDLSPTP